MMKNKAECTKILLKKRDIFLKGKKIEQFYATMRVLQRMLCCGKVIFVYCEAFLKIT